MSQKLILPMNKCVFTAGYKNAAYLKQQGTPHYGVDLYGEDSQNVYSPGAGVVFSCGYDSRFGNSIVIVYPDVQLPGGQVLDLSCRMFHFAKIRTFRGQLLKQGQLLGVAGNTGIAKVNGKPMGVHLHTEFDGDTDYPQYAYGIRSNGNIIRRGVADSTIDPSLVWHRGKGQSIRGEYAGWFRDRDVELPLM